MQQLPMLSLMRGVEDDGVKRASAGKPIPGYDIKIFDEEGYELEAHHEGYLVIKLPLPPGALMGIWGDYERFHYGYLAKFIKNYGKFYQKIQIRTHRNRIRRNFRLRLLPFYWVQYRNLCHYV